MLNASVSLRSPEREPGSGKPPRGSSGSRDGRSSSAGGESNASTETASIVGDAGGTCLAHELDVTDAESVERFFAAAEERVRHRDRGDQQCRDRPLRTAGRLLAGGDPRRDRDQAHRRALHGSARHPSDATRRRRRRHPLRHVVGRGATLAVASPVRGGQRRRRARGADAAPGAGGHRHPRERPAVRRDTRHGLQHAGAGERTHRAGQ